MTRKNKPNANPLVYACFTCGAKGQKLWRDYNTVLSAQILLCLPCLGERAGEKISSSSDQLGGFVPAIPTELPDAKGKIPKNESYWGYTSVPDWGVKWWHELPPALAQSAQILSQKLETREETQARKETESKAFQDRNTERIKQACYVVYGMEAFDFWTKWQGIVPCTPLSEGFSETIGRINKRPICVSVYFYSWNEKLVAFVNPTSTLVDWDMIHSWISKSFPCAAIGYTCNAVNSGQVISHVDPMWSKRPDAKRLFDQRTRCY